MTTDDYRKVLDMCDNYGVEPLSVAPFAGNICALLNLNDYKRIFHGKNVEVYERIYTIVVDGVRFNAVCENITSPRTVTL